MKLVLCGAAGLLLAVPALSQAQLARPAAPRGMRATDISGIGGRVLTSRLSGAPSAKKMLQAVRMVLGEYFDGPPALRTAIANQNGQEYQAAFVAKLRGVPVRGVIGLTMVGDTALSTVVYDRPIAIAASYSKLAAALGAGGAPAGKGAPVPPLTRTPLPDGSGSVSLASGWRITGAYKGTVDIVGPGGAVMGLGAPMSVVGYAADTAFGPDVPNPFPGSPRVNFRDPVRALLDLNAFAVRQGQGGRMTILGATPFNIGNGAPAALIHWSAPSPQGPIEALGLYAIHPIDNIQGMFYMSQCIAPVARFRKLMPTMWAQWMSWGVSDAVLKGRLLQAAQSLRGVGDIITGSHANTQETYARVNKGWSQYFRDVATVEDTRTGDRADNVGNNAAWALTEAGSPYRIVPVSDL